MVGGEDVRGLPLHERRSRLRDLIAGIPGLTFSEAFDGDGEALFRQACRAGLEGIVSKRLDAPYRCGRASSWVKVKNPAYPRCDA
jgi:bifunctional non-homologous end joining protein LigD